MEAEGRTRDHRAAGKGGRPREELGIAPRGSAIIYLVRHADAGDKAAWPGVDLHRPLSPQGEREAAGLVFRLDDLPIDRILSSPALRCEQTVRPLADRRRLAIEHSSLLEIGADVVELSTRIDVADRTVLCTHGEVIAELLPTLVADGAVVTEPLVWPKGATWILHRTAGGPYRGRFLPALAWPVAWGLHDWDGRGSAPLVPRGRRRRRHRATRRRAEDDK